MLRNERPGCLTTYGIISAIVTVLVVVSFAAIKGGRLFNPGALNAQAGKPLSGVRSHAEFSDQCDLCHASFWSTNTMADKCVVCHTDVAVQLLVPSPLHGLLQKSYPDLTCNNCHPEHGGSNAAITNMAKIQFSHDTVGFTLTVHKSKTDGTPYVCDDCHAEGYANFDQSRCTTCHTKIETTFIKNHTQNFGSNCLACHDGLDSYGSNFNHNSVAFPLGGKHAEVNCADCHTNARTLADLKTTPQDCNTCHKTQDPHESRFGSDCGSCHSVNGWSPAKFDHNLSTFKLTGQHVNVGCENCHTDHVFAGTPIDCNACHAVDDVHQGNLGTRCDNCHTTFGWSPSTFNHNLASFILTGAHITTACTSCHFSNTFTGISTDCLSCHQKDDTHNGQFGTGCSTCHSTSAWKPANFDHNLSGFPLTGAHTSVQCSQCHASGVYQGLATECVSCHAEPAVHAGQFGTDCAQCHTTDNWNATFNHPGGCDGNCADHRGATCADCHPDSYSTYTCLKCHDSNKPGD